MIETLKAKFLEKRGAILLIVGAFVGMLGFNDEWQELVDVVQSFVDLLSAVDPNQGVN